MIIETKKFAEEFERDEKGWIHFKRDVHMRRSRTPESLHKAIGAHPSKMNLYLADEIAKFVAKPGETILDPFGGAGSTMLASEAIGCKSISIELEYHYFNIIQEVARGLNGDTNTHRVIHGDSRRVMPIPCDHIITSPPYGNDMFKESGALARTSDHADTRQEEVANYGKSFTNLGRLPPFVYVQQLQKFLDGMIESLRVGGTLTMTHRDRTRAGTRVLYAMEIAKSLMKKGMELYLWEKWKVPGAIQATYNKKQGIEVIEEEDVLFFRKI